MVCAARVSQAGGHTEVGHRADPVPTVHLQPNTALALHDPSHVVRARVLTVACRERLFVHTEG